MRMDFKIANWGRVHKNFFGIVIKEMYEATNGASKDHHVLLAYRSQSISSFS